MWKTARLGLIHYRERRFWDLAPEQQGAKPDKATPASDAWALGVMIFRFLTGFWFERANREKCLALLDDCELPWCPLIARLCAETPEGRLAEEKGYPLGTNVWLNANADTKENFKNMDYGSNCGGTFYVFDRDAEKLYYHYSTN